MKYLSIAALSVLILTQWLVPARMISNKEATIEKGRLLKFAVAPVDPLDYFKGRYIYLAYRENSFRLPDKTALQQDDEVFVSFSADSAGFVHIRAVSKLAPENDPFYVKAVVNYITRDSGLMKIDLRYFFHEYYMEESKAMKAETYYREHVRRDSSHHAYALVYVWKGDAVIKDVVIDSVSIDKITQ
jgi:uncharacterized membrane-anchored protein